MSLPVAEAFHNPQPSHFPMKLNSPLFALIRFSIAVTYLIFFCPAHAENPNVVLIVTDDMGYADLAPFGNSEIPTPNLTRLAKSGVALTNAHASAPICVPSRMGLFTGRYQQRFGVYTNVYTAPESRLWLEETTLADVLQDHGYRTGLVGKWHLSGNKLPWDMVGPDRRGFDEFVGLGGGMSDYWKGSELVRWENGDYKPFEAPEYLTDFFGHEAEDFIDRHAAEPFFLYLAFNAPHAPLHALESDQEAITADWISPERRVYGGMVVAIDRNVGRVLDSLKEHGIEKDTLIILINDNGGGGDNAKWFTRNTARNLPYRGHKYDVQQGGVRVPMIVSWPGTLPAGETFGGLSSALDIFPTVLSAANLPHPENRECDGVDLLPWLQGESTGDPHEFLCWQQVHIDRPNQRPPGQPSLHYFAIRSGPWKAIKQDQQPEGSDNRAWELYDIARDPSELQDVSSEYPDITSKLAGQFSSWQNDMHPLIPKPKNKKKH